MIHEARIMKKLLLALALLPSLAHAASDREAVVYLVGAIAVGGILGLTYIIKLRGDINMLNEKIQRLKYELEEQGG